MTGRWCCWPCSPCVPAGSFHVGTGCLANFGVEHLLEQARPVGTLGDHERRAVAGPDDPERARLRTREQIKMPAGMRCDHRRRLPASCWPTVFYWLEAVSAERRAPAASAALLALLAQVVVRRAVRLHVRAADAVRSARSSP